MLGCIYIYIYWGYIGIMEKKMETIIMGYILFGKRIYRTRGPEGLLASEVRQPTLAHCGNLELSDTPRKRRPVDQTAKLRPDNAQSGIREAPTVSLTVLGSAIECGYPLT